MADPLVVFGREGMEHPEHEAPFGMDDPLVVLSGWALWRMERPQNSVWNRQLSRCFRWMGALARGASCEFVCLESTTILLFWARGSAGAWSVLRILFGMHDPLTVFGGWKHGRSFSQKRREGFFVKKRALFTPQHLHHSHTRHQSTTAPTPRTYTTASTPHQYTTVPAPPTKTPRPRTCARTYTATTCTPDQYTTVPTPTYSTAPRPHHVHHSSYTAHIHHSTYTSPRTPESLRGLDFGNAALYTAPTPQLLHNTYITAATPHHDRTTWNTARYASLANVELIGFGIIGVEFFLRVNPRSQCRHGGKPKSKATSCVNFMQATSKAGESPWLTVRPARKGNRLANGGARTYLERTLWSSAVLSTLAALPKGSKRRLAAAARWQRTAAEAGPSGRGFERFWWKSISITQIQTPFSPSLQGLIMPHCSNSPKRMCKKCFGHDQKFCSVLAAPRACAAQ